MDVVVFCVFYSIVNYLHTIELMGMTVGEAGGPSCLRYPIQMTCWDVHQSYHRSFPSFHQESNTLNDPLAEFLVSLYVNCDFEDAQEKLKACREVLDNDFFLAQCQEEVMDNSRMFIFETYCTIHSRIDIVQLADKLGVDQSAAERWIVNLVRDASLDAKIDSKVNHVMIASEPLNIYQQVIEKTQGLSFRSYVLANNIENQRKIYAD